MWLSWAVPYPWGHEIQSWSIKDTLIAQIVLRFSNTELGNPKTIRQVMDSCAKKSITILQWLVESKSNRVQSGGQNIPFSHPESYTELLALKSKIISEIADTLCFWDITLLWEWIEWICDGLVEFEIEDLCIIHEWLKEKIHNSEYIVESRDQVKEQVDILLWFINQIYFKVGSNPALLDAFVERIQTD